MKLQQVLNDREVKYGAAPNGRLYYLALPPSVYPQVHTPCTFQIDFIV